MCASRIEDAAHSVDAQLMNALSESTYNARKCYLRLLLKTADKMGIDAPCQELYDEFVANNHGSGDRRFHLEHCIKLIDAYADTRAQRLDGTLYNEPSLPSIADAIAVLADVVYPIESVDVGILIAKTESEMGYLGLSASTMGQYEHAWKDVYRYFFLRGSTEYNKAVAMDYIAGVSDQKYLGQMKAWKLKINKRAVAALIEVAESGHFKWAHAREKPHCNDGALDDIRVLYLTSLSERNLEQSTVSLHDYVFRHALMHAKIDSVEELAEICQEHVLAMVKKFACICNRRSLATILPILRKILDFLHEKGFGKFRMSGMVMATFVQRGNLAKYIAPDDIEKLLGQLEHESQRDKAIILLAFRLGLRDCDICNLTFRDIEWETDSLHLAQKKTGRPLTLPLPSDVGNALMDYIVSERPSNGNSPYVFLRQQAPYRKLSSIYHICSGVAKRSAIAPVNGTALGAHLYRYTLVHRLLDAKVSHQVITDALGHSSRESDKPYLSMDESMLRMCALDLSVIGSIGWEKGVDND